MKSKRSQTASALPTAGPAPSAPPAISSVDSLLNGKKWHLLKGDCIELMPTLPARSIDFSVFSPPFPSVYAYTSEVCDIGNSEDLNTEAKLHLSWFYNQLARVMKPGRVVCVHVQQIVKMKRAGEQGLFDFRGLNIRIAERAGLIYEQDIPITKNPQAQAIRTKSRELQFAGLERDRARSRPSLPDYIIKFVAPGENAVRIDNKEVSRQEWIEWAEGVWTWHEIKATDTLNTAEAKGENDTKHICPLQLGAINRLVRLYSMPGEVVLSPFAGVGSEGYESVRLGRRFIGCELKDEYYEASIRNLTRAESQCKEAAKTLFDQLQEV